MIQQHIKDVLLAHIKIRCNGIALRNGCDIKQTSAYQAVLQAQNNALMWLL